MKFSAKAAIPLTVLFLGLVIMSLPGTANADPILCTGIGTICVENPRDEIDKMIGSGPDDAKDAANYTCRNFLGMPCFN